MDRSAVRAVKFPRRDCGAVRAAVSQGGRLSSLRPRRCRNANKPVWRFSACPSATVRRVNDEGWRLRGLILQPKLSGGDGGWFAATIMRLCLRSTRRGRSQWGFQPWNVRWTWIGLCKQSPAIWAQGVYGQAAWCCAAKVAGRAAEAGGRSTRCEGEEEQGHA
jgi:hypothetical protein